MSEPSRVPCHEFSVFLSPSCHRGTKPACSQFKTSLLLSNLWKYSPVLCGKTEASSLVNFPALFPSPTLLAILCPPHPVCSGLNKIFPKLTICVSAFSLKISSPLLLQTQCCGRMTLSPLTMVCLEPGLPSGLYFHPTGPTCWSGSM